MMRRSANQPARWAMLLRLAPMMLSYVLSFSSKNRLRERKADGQRQA
jgi:hypothetical protein